MFARAPDPGACKTRLIPGYGRIGAARIYRQLVLRTVRMALAAGCGPVEVWAAPSPAHRFFAGLRERYPLTLRRQPQGDLGRRMCAALNATLRAGNAAAILVGTDAANLEAQDLRDAARRLTSDCDAAIQPAEDGGYVLIGLSGSRTLALPGIAWSTGREYAQTRARMRSSRLRVAALRVRADVDHPVDVRRARRAGWL